MTGHAHHHRAHADADARLVHHVEHLRQALVRRADQFADAVAALAELEEGVDDAALAELVVEPGQPHVVVGAHAAIVHAAVVHAAIVADPVARHDEQADPAHPRRSARNLCQHQVHDVFRQLVFAARDPHLLAADAVAAIVRRFGTGRDVGQRRARLRFAQAHRAQEAPVEQRLAVARLLRGRGERAQQVGDAARQQQVARGRRVGCEQLRIAQQHHAVGKLQAAVRGIGAERAESGVAVGVHRLAHGRGQDHAAIGEVRFLDVAKFPVRRKALARQPCGRVEHGRDLVAVVLGKTREAKQVVQRPELFVDVGELARIDQGRIDRKRCGIRGLAGNARRARDLRRRCPAPDARPARRTDSCRATSGSRRRPTAWPSTACAR